MLLANAAAAKSVADRLEAVMDALRATVDADPRLAFFALMNACHDAVDRLGHLDVPPIAGGSPDVDFDGPTPLSVLAASAPFNAGFDAWMDRMDAVRDCWTEADQFAAHGCV